MASCRPKMKGQKQVEGRDQRNWLECKVYETILPARVAAKHDSDSVGVGNARLGANADSHVFDFTVPLASSMAYDWSRNFRAVETAVDRRGSRRVLSTFVPAD
jgi:hypothetical protein